MHLKKIKLPVTAKNCPNIVNLWLRFYWKLFLLCESTVILPTKCSALLNVLWKSVSTMIPITFYSIIKKNGNFVHSKFCSSPFFNRHILMNRFLINFVRYECMMTLQALLFIACIITHYKKEEQHKMLKKAADKYKLYKVVPGA